jgi:mycothiol synthase
MIHDRPIRFPDDVWPVRDFLSALYPISPPGTVWDVRRWDGSIFYSEAPGLDPARAVRSRLWVTEAGRIVAAAMSEGGRQIHPHVHPEAAHLLEDVIAWAEEAAAAAGDDRVLLTVWEADEATQRVATARGYGKTDRWEVVRSTRPGSAPLPQLPIADGYVLRSTRDDPGDHQAVADLLNAAFERTVHYAGEHAGFTRRAPSFRRETDLVAEAPDGSFAAYAAVCWDSCNRRATFEPVCTHPAHRRRGLARTLMHEGMLRAIGLGAAVIDVATGDADPANALYASLPFTEAYRGRLWVRDLPASRDGD